MANGKGKEKALKILSAIGNVAVGAVSGFNPIVGMAVNAGKAVVDTVKEEVEANKAEEDKVVGPGRINWAKLIPKLAVALTIIVVGVSLATGLITFQEFTKALKILIKSM